MFPRNLLGSLSGVLVVTGIYAFIVPARFFAIVPGLSMTGPYNVHLVRDVALVLLVSGAAMIWGAATRRRAVAITGAAWLVLHAVFHLQVWAARGFALDAVAAFNVPVVIALPFVALWAAMNVGNGKRRHRHGP